MILIENIDQLSKYVKINAATNWETYKPFVRDAQDKYIAPYFGEALLDRLHADDNLLLKEYICRALGPFSLALATHEMSINFGETGHTVSRTDKLAPASDAKIARATESLFARAWHNLDRSLSYLHSNLHNYREWNEANVERKVSTALFNNHLEFQDKGLIDINYSPLTFHRLRTLTMRVEQSETLFFLPAGYEYADNSTLLQAMQAYTATRVAALLTNNPTDNSLKDHPPIQFIQDGQASSDDNYYANEALFWQSTIKKLLVADGAIDDSGGLKYNTAVGKVFVGHAKRK